MLQDLVQPPNRQGPTHPDPSGWIGVSAQNGTDGAVVTDVSPGGPGAEAGIKVGDVVQALDGRLIKDKDLKTQSRL
jgi:S1-C subfamily serine protease